MSAVMHSMAEADLESRDQTEMDFIEVKEECHIKEEMELQEEEENGNVAMGCEAKEMGPVMQNAVQAGAPLPINGLLSMESRIEEGSWNLPVLTKEEGNMEDLTEIGFVLTNVLWSSLPTSLEKQFYHMNARQHTSYMWPYVLQNEMQWKPGKSLETIEMRREKQRLQKRRSRASKSEEELAKIRERDRLYKKKIREMETAFFTGMCPLLTRLDRSPKSDQERRERQRLQKRQSRANMSAEALAKERERNKLYKRKIRAALLEQAYTGTYVPHTLLQWKQGRPLETLEERRIRQRLAKRRSRARMSEEALAKERERDRMRKRKVRAASSEEEIERWRQEERTDTTMCPRSRFDKNASIFKMADKTVLSSAFSLDQLHCQRESNGNSTARIEGAPSTGSEDQNSMSRVLIENKIKTEFPLLPGQFEQQRECNQSYIRNYPASLPEDKLEQKRERDRVLQRMTQEVIRERTCASAPILSAQQLQSQQDDNRNSSGSAEMPSEKEDQNPLLGSYNGNKTNAVVAWSSQQLEQQREHWNYFTRFQTSLPENDQKREHDWVKRRRMREMVREQTKKLKNLFMDSDVEFCESQMAQENTFVNGVSQDGIAEQDNVTSGAMAEMMDGSFETVK